jgi:hypothetical protein
MKNIISFFIFIIMLLSCERDREGYNPLLENYHRIEFDVVKNYEKEKKVGVAFLNLDLFSETEIHIHGIYQGNLFIKSTLCDLNYKGRYNGLEQIKLKNLIKNKKIDKKLCDLNIYLESDTVKNYLKYEESGIVYIFFENMIKNFNVLFSDSELSKNYTFKDNSALQLRSSSDISKSFITINNNYIKDWEYTVSGCGGLIKGVAGGSRIKIYLDQVFNKKDIKKSDSCLMSVRIKNFDNSIQEIYLFFNIFDFSTKKLSKIKYYVENNKLYAEGNLDVKICSINDSFLLYTCPGEKVICQNEYDPNTLYWVRGLTLGGRKNVIGIKNSQIVWEE